MSSYRVSNWASKLTLVAGEIMLLGGFLAFFYDNSQLPGVNGIALGVYAVILGLIVVMFHYPAKFMGQFLLVVQQNYILNGVLNIAFAGFLFVQLPTHLAGILMICAGLMYFVAAYRKEPMLTLEQVNETL